MGPPPRRRGGLPGAMTGRPEIRSRRYGRRGSPSPSRPGNSHGDRRALQAPLADRAVLPLDQADPQDQALRGHSENAVRIQIAVALIAYLILNSPTRRRSSSRPPRVRTTRPFQPHAHRHIDQLPYHNTPTSKLTTVTPTPRGSSPGMTAGVGRECSTSSVIPLGLTRGPMKRGNRGCPVQSRSTPADPLSVATDEVRGPVWNSATTPPPRP